MTKKTPTELLFGRKATNPAQGILNNVVSEEVSDKTIDEVRSEAADLIKENQEINKTRYDKHRKKVLNIKKVIS